MDSKTPGKLNPGIKTKYSFTKINTLGSIESIKNWTDTISTELSVPEYLKEQDNFCMILEGWIKIPKDGVYRFYIASDDGSRLYINDNLICDNDGVHGSDYYVKGFAGLKEGFHKIKLEYFEAKYGEDLSVEMEGPDFSRKIIPAEILYSNTLKELK
jgi:hypothetical protein